MYVHLCLDVHAIARVWRLENNLYGLVLSFYHVSSGAGTQAVMCGSGCLDPLSHLAGLILQDY